MHGDLFLKIFIEKLLKVPQCTLHFKRFSLGIGGITIAVLLPTMVVMSYTVMSYTVMPGE